MELLTETVPNEDLKKFEKIYHEQLYKNDISTKAQFEYAWCLVRSKYPADIRKGIVLLQELFKTHEEGRRDYLYYLAIGNARLREYKKALDYVKLFLEIEPGNQQVQALRTVIKKQMEQEGLKGLAIAGGAVVALGAAVGLGIAILSKSKTVFECRSQER